MVALAGIDSETYLAVHQGHTKPTFGLIKPGEEAVRYRSLHIEDWESALVGEVLAACGVPAYPGELLILVAQPERHQLVHLQLRNWTKTPKSAVLGVVSVPASWRSLACPDATAQTLGVLAFSDVDGLVQADIALPAYELVSRPAGTPLPPMGEYYPSALYAQGQELWMGVRGEWGSMVWYLDLGSAEQHWQLAHRIDGFQMTGLAAGVGGVDLSFVVGDAVLGSAWRPLVSANRSTTGQSRH